MERMIESVRIGDLEAFVTDIPEHGIVLRDLLKLCAGLDANEFGSLFPFPFLIQQTHAGGGKGRATLTLSTADEDADAEKSYNPLDRIVFGVTKRNQSRLADVITIGREASNDIVLPYRFISKEHAFFSQSGSDWQLIDNNSTNGVYVGKKRLEAGETKILRNKIELAISRYLRFQFIGSTHMFNFLRLASTLYG